MEKLSKSFLCGTFFLKMSKYKSDKKPASVDLPKVINSAEI
jgi:hypothetical protein